MCGIIGYCGKEPLPVLTKGLEALEYRGYDSAGIAVLGDSSLGFSVARAVGRVSSLSEELCNAPLKGNGVEYAGIGHTRWATHGAPSVINCHPHGTDDVLIVHNGIIENYARIKAALSDLGYTFESDTDTEAAAKLIDHLYKNGSGQGDPVRAILESASLMKGSFALGILFKDRPGRVYAIRRQSPLILAYQGDEGFIASDVTAILGRVREFYRLPEGTVAVLRSGSADFFIGDADGYERAATAEAERTDWSVDEARRGGFEFFMHKEMLEVPSVLERTSVSKMADGLPSLALPLLDGGILANKIKSGGGIHIVGCGTAMHAGLVGKFFIEKFARVPASVEVASEFRYRDPILSEKDTAIFLSQSGETADTIAACRYAREHKVTALSVLNVCGSTLSLESDEVLYTHAGPEIAVASTKAYSVQCASLLLIAVSLSLSLGTMTKTEAKRICAALSDDVPHAVKRALGLDLRIRKIAASIKDAEHVFFIGRGLDHTICLEGSLKLKEISYIHSEAYPSGELKHGTISLITDGVPVIALMTDQKLYEKSLSAIREVKSRGARVIALVSEDILEKETEGGIPADEVVAIPSVGKTHPECSPLTLFPAASTLQLLAFHTAKALGYDVDKPRNLAKSVTVE